ncbi:MAG TPA: ABC transporter permease [Candidatus Baltobacteraceae bacterium]|nr:ABC transporter permease [Candidatus Baltobacteraceae bacterium]
MDDLGTVFVAELLRRIRSRPFMIGVVIGILTIAAITRLPAILDRAFSGSNAVVLMGDRTLVDRARPLLSERYAIKATIDTQRVDAALLQRYHATAAIALARSARGLSVDVFAHDPGSFGKTTLTRALMPLQLQLTMRLAPRAVTALTTIPIAITPIGSKFASTAQADAARGVAYTLMFFLYILILLNSQLVMTSVAEEKTSRIAELLIASVDPSALLAGKVLAGALLSVLQLVIWIATSMYLGGSPAAGSHGAAQDPNSMLSLGNLFDVLTPAVLVAFLVYFAIGFFQLSTLMAAFASLINRTEDLGSISMPLVMPVVAALFIAIAALGAPDASFAVVTSMIPILSPFVMFARIAVSNVPLWQIGLSLAINLIALYYIAILAGKIYRVGMLLYGRPPKLSQIWHVIRA